jgi:hypothetical protein
MELCTFSKSGLQVVDNRYESWIAWEQVETIRYLANQPIVANEFQNSTLF